MKWRKILAAGMGLVLAAGLMSGCGDQKKETGSGKKDDQEKAMGRYVEEDLKPPVQDGETPLGAYKKGWDTPFVYFGRQPGFGYKILFLSISGWTMVRGPGRRRIDCNGF